MKHLTPLLLLAAGCASSSVAHELQAADEDRAPRLTVPVAREGFTLAWSGEDAPDLADLLGAYGLATGQAVVTTSDTRQVLHKKQLDRVDGRATLEVPAESVHEVTEALLAMHLFVLVPLHEEEPRIVQAVSLETQERNFIRRSAVFVPSDELDAWRGRAATMITTSLYLPHTDVRTLANSMRTMLVDANLQQMVPVGSSSSLVLTGLASDVWALAGTLRRIDALEADALEADAPAAAEGEGEDG